MNKQEFFDALRVRLSGLPDVDISERLAFYGEMIDDRIEDGTSEEDAIAMIGSADMVAEQIIADIPLAKLVKDKITPKKLRAWEIVLLVLGSPVWLSLLIAAFAVVFCIYVSLWAVTAALWAVFAALAAGAVGGISLGVYLAFCGRITDGIALIGAALASAGLAIFMFYACLAVTKLVIRATRKFIVWLKNRLIRKEDAE